MNSEVKHHRWLSYLQWMIVACIILLTTGLFLKFLLPVNTGSNFILFFLSSGIAALLAIPFYLMIVFMFRYRRSGDQAMARWVFFMFAFLIAGTGLLYFLKIQ